MFKHMLGSLHLASLPKTISYVADLGCGTGVWTREFAAMHPEASVLGIDLNPPKPDPNDPPNVYFVKANIEHEWSFSSQPYDFVFIRLLITAIKDWSELFKKIHQSLTPGGCFEIYEGVITMRADDPEITLENSAILRWYDAVRKLLSSRGIDPDVPVQFGAIAKAAGFESVNQSFIQMYLDPERAVQHDHMQSAQISSKLRSDIDDLLTFMSERMFNDSTTPTGSQMMKMAEEARVDLIMNSKSRGYHVYQYSSNAVNFHAQLTVE